jgi:general secretion pathway protein G
MPSVIDLLPSVGAHQQHASARKRFVYKLRQLMPRVGKTEPLQPHSRIADTFAIVDSLTILGVISSFAFPLFPFSAKPQMTFSCVPLPPRAVRLPHKSVRGFTLIEIMIVVVILGILAAVVVPRIMNRPDDARVTAAQSDIRVIMQQLKLYRLDSGAYPSTDQGLQALVTKPTTNPVPANWKAYLDKVPLDPWKRPYRYLNPGQKGEIDVYSVGADGEPGGEGNNADIGSWDI